MHSIGISSHVVILFSNNLLIYLESSLFCAMRASEERRPHGIVGEIVPRSKLDIFLRVELRAKLKLAAGSGVSRQWLAVFSALEGALSMFRVVSWVL